MRNIKFRAKIKYNGNHRFSGDWIYGYYWYHEIEEKHYIKESEDIDGLGTFLHEDFEVDPKTVGQLTGENDEGGKDIYEGDIVRHLFFCENTGTRKNEMNVTIGDDVDCPITDVAWLFEIDNGTGEKPINEIIGNIHENPELLK